MVLPGFVAIAAEDSLECGVITEMRTLSLVLQMLLEALLVSSETDSCGQSVQPFCYLLIFLLDCGEPLFAIRSIKRLVEAVRRVKMFFTALIH